MFIKVSGITTVDDALLATALGADAVAFDMAPSLRQIAPIRVQKIVSRLPPDLLTIGVFRNEAPQRVSEIVNRCGLRAAQLHGHENIADTRLVRDRVPIVIKTLPGGSGALAKANQYGADIVQVNSKSSGSSQVFDWSQAEETPRGIRLIMSGYLTPDNVAAAIDKVRPWGVDVSSEVELSPGCKDPVSLRAFINAVRKAQSTQLDPKGSKLADFAPYDWQEEYL